jgi:hypothetical protein
MARGRSNYIPRPDGDFAAWVNHFYGAVKSWWDDRGFDPGELTPLEDALSAWNTRYPDHVAAQ